MEVLTLQMLTHGPPVGYVDEATGNEPYAEY